MQIVKLVQAENCCKIFAHLREKEKMKAFGNYSRYYNLLYKDKDYIGEAGFIHDLIQKHSPAAKNILDLGCGTGRHDLLLAEKGYAIAGVDMSEEMLLIARSQELNSSTAQQLNFLHGDIRTFRVDKKFRPVRVDNS